MTQEEEDYAFAMQSIRTLDQVVRQEFHSSYKGMSVWGSLKDHFFMRPVDVSHLKASQIGKIREADIPILGETKGSDIDATIYVENGILTKVCAFLGERINQYNETLRFEHILIVPYDDALSMFHQLKILFQNRTYTKAHPQKIRCMFAICEETQRETGTVCKERINETLVVETLGRNYFEDAFLGIRYGMVDTLETLLDLDPPTKLYLTKIRQHALEMDSNYYPKYLRKKNRFVRYQQILQE